MQLQLFLSTIVSYLLEDTVMENTWEIFINTMLQMMIGLRWKQNWRHPEDVMLPFLCNNPYFLNAHSPSLQKQEQIKTKLIWETPKLSLIIPQCDDISIFDPNRATLLDGGWHSYGHHSGHSRNLAMGSHGRRDGKHPPPSLSLSSRLFLGGWGGDEWSRLQMLTHAKRVRGRETHT